MSPTNNVFCTTMIKKKINNVLIRAATNILEHAQNSRNKTLLSQLSVGDVIVKQIKPLGQIKTPGITKAGRLSFQGYAGDTKVKVYACHSIIHRRFREAIQQTHFGQKYLPDILAAEDVFVVEPWIEGKHPEPGHLTHQKACLEMLKTMQHDQEMIGFASKNTNSFCYFFDYLKPRLEKWKAFANVKRFLSEWEDAYNSVKSELPVRLSHPDLQSANIIQEKSSGKLLIIDNELLGVGHGWILDWHNSFLHKQNKTMPKELMASEFPELVDLSWRLRKAGSAFDKSDLQLASNIFNA